MFSLCFPLSGQESRRGRRILLGAGLVAVLAAPCPPATAQVADTIAYTNTLYAAPDDTPGRILDKAVHVVPTPQQWAAMNNEFIAFIHFGPNTFTRREWGTGKESPADFALRRLDTDQWCAVLAAAGMKKVILTVKHHDGFVLWQSRYTRHGVMSSPFCEGKGDVLRDLAASCRKFGLQLGIYLSPADLFQMESPEGLYGNLSPQTLRTIPREVPGRPFSNPTRFRFVVDDYNEYFLNQLFELLTEYGPIHEVWLDGAHPRRKGGQRYNYAAWRRLIHTLAPEAVVFGREDLRWCGNEAGATRPTEWNVIPYVADPDTLQHFDDLTAADLGSRAQLRPGRYLHYQPAETNTSIREGWFYRDDERQGVRSADDVFDIYERAVGGNSIFLLNVPPNREGRLSPHDATVLCEVGRRIRQTYGHDLLEGAEGPAQLLDDDPDSYLTLPEAGGAVELRLPEAVRLDRFVVQEAVRLRGERVEEHALDVWTDGAWKEVARATNIGYKRILRFAPVTTDRLRLRILRSRRAPALSHVSAHYYVPRPPRLVASRSLDGRVSLAPRPDAFSWKPHGEEAAANLNAGYTIHYTTDGSKPTADAPRYTAPFVLEHGEVKAIALLDGQRGELLRAEFGYIKKDWKAEGNAAPDEAQAAAAAIDADPATAWLPADDGTPQVLTLDLGRDVPLTAFVYTPPADGRAPLMSGGTVEWSRDGRHWERAGSFSFGNLQNSPLPRRYDLPQAVTARYVRLTVTETTAGKGRAAVAEIDWF